MTVVWVACLTLGTILLALFAGMMLDRVLNSKPLFTLLLTLASIPLTIFLTLRIVRSATRHLQPTGKQELPREENEQRGKDNRSGS